MEGIAFHPRHASQQHSGAPDYALARELVEALPVPVMLSGGLSSDERAGAPSSESGADAVMLARGALGNPWLFGRLLGTREERAHAARGRSRSSSGSSAAPRITSVWTARAATCASSIPGTRSISA